MRPDDIATLDEALFHLTLANLPPDIRQTQVDQLLDRRLALTDT